MLTISGVFVALLGIGGLAFPTFTTQKTKDIARIGSVNVQIHEDRHHAIPSSLSGVAIGLGVIMIGGGLLRKQY